MISLSGSSEAGTGASRRGFEGAAGTTEAELDDALGTPPARRALPPEPAPATEEPPAEPTEDAAPSPAEPTEPTEPKQLYGEKRVRGLKARPARPARKLTAEQIAASKAALATYEPAAPVALSPGGPAQTELAARIDDVSITYRTTFERKPTLRQALVRFGRGQRALKEVQALKHVSFEVRAGTALGIVGANGAGKSTLMRAISGILPPTTGKIEVWGRASTLLALGVGFNANLSGRENIVLGGLAAGLTRSEVEERAEEIAEWTELGDFIDVPMRTYSSGMYSRVGFSLAVHMQPDILMIDEAMSTGDAHFREKANAKMAELRDKARAMFLVSHGLGSIREMCTEAIWLDKGRLMMQGEPDEVVNAYQKFLKVKRSATTEEDI